MTTITITAITKATGTINLFHRANDSPDIG